MSSIDKPTSERARLANAVINSANGLKSAYQNENAFRGEVWTAAVMLPIAFWLGRGWVEIALLGGSVWLVLIVELLNTSVEATVDRVSLQWHELSKQAKDLGSAAVMLSLMLCGCIWAAAIVTRFV